VFRGMVKNTGPLFTISELAEELGITPRTIRYSEGADYFMVYAKTRTDFSFHHMNLERKRPSNDRYSERTHYKK